MGHGCGERHLHIPEETRELQRFHLWFEDATQLPGDVRVLARIIASAIDGHLIVRDQLLPAAAEVSGATTVVDSSKHSALAYCLRWSADIDLRVVHVVRDSRGVAYSWTKTVARPEADGEEMTRYRPGRAALLWNAHNAAFGLLRRTGVPVYRLRYEELVANPAGALREVAKFAGVDPGPMDFFGDGTVRLGTGHSAAGNPMRFTTGEVPLRHDDAWRLSLPARQRRLVGALTAPLLSAYGYGRR